jgi:hypothetical protein
MKGSATLIDGKQLAAVCRIKALRPSALLRVACLRIRGGPIIASEAAKFVVVDRVPIPPLSSSCSLALLPSSMQKKFVAEKLSAL